MQNLTLATWLEQLDRPLPGGRDELLLGGSGHLLLSAEEEIQVAHQLRDGVLPRLFEGAQSRPVCVLTGLAPGADLLFTRVVSEWLREAGVACRIVGLLPLPTSLLLDDWTSVAQASGAGNADLIERQRDLLAQTLASCSSLIDLLPPDTRAEQLQTAAFHQRQYRRLAACLAQRSDILVAILRRENPSRPGGTAEVVEWRRRPQQVPPDYSTITATLTVLPKRRLILIDPETSVHDSGTRPDAPPDTPESFAQRADAAMQAGNYVHCYDLTQQARARGLDSPRLQYLSLLALVNAGSTALAWRRYGELGLRGDERDEDWLALKGRLLKDLALNSLTRTRPDASLSSDASNNSADLGATPLPIAAETAAAFLQSAQAYLAAYRLTGGHFSAINAATMYQLAGDSPRAQTLAAEVLRLLADIDGDSESERYYRHVTEAEASLLLGDVARYRHSLERADALMRGNFNARSRTRSQLRLLCRVLALDPQLPTLLWLPDVIRVRRRALASAPVQSRAAVFGDFTGALVFVVLAAIADLDIAETLIARGAHLHVVLPSERSSVLLQWQEQFGSAAARRLQKLLDQAGDITVARGFLHSESLWSQDYVGAVADGLAALDAQRLGCRVRELELDDDALRIAEPAPLAATSTESEALPSRAIASGQRLFAGLIFADIVGFRRLHDDDLPRFWEVVMGSMARIVERFGSRVLFRGTWGDALHLVTVDAVTAAEIAIAIQARFEQMRATESGGLADIELRLAAHFGPVYSGHDPVANKTVFYGSQLAFTARIEPITPPGMIFVTELLAARLMLDATQRFSLDYVGELELAKRYGSYRLFSLRAVERRRPASHVAVGIDDPSMQASKQS